MDPGRPPDEGDVLTVAQVQRLVPLPRATIYALVGSGQLPSYRLSPNGRARGRVLVHRDDVLALLEKSRVARPSAPVNGHAAAPALSPRVARPVSPVRVDVDRLLERLRRRRRTR